MSQLQGQPVETDEESIPQGQDTGFDEGFDLGEDAQPAEQPQTAPAEQSTEPPAYQEQPLSMQEQANIQQQPQAAPDEQPAPQATTPMLEAVPDELQEAMSELKALNPKAAALAMEDTPDGQAIRARLEEWGATIAQDRAEVVISQREQAQHAQMAEMERAKAEVARHNEHFFSVLQRECPDYSAMLSNPARRAECIAYQQELLAWIQAKPYSEAKPLMQIAESGRDPVQVAGLLTRFENERKAGAAMRRADPTAALAVPGRGAPTAPAGIGDKDDFDAGWSLGE